jgi:hypothetical protein
VNYGPARLRYERRKRHRQRQLANSGFWNILTVVFSIATILLVVWFASQFIKNGNANNSSDQQRLKTGELQPSKQAKVGNGAILRTEIENRPAVTVTPTDSKEDETNFMFDLQAEKEMLSASLFRTDRTCNWLGVAGQVFDLQGRPITGITVQVSGPLYGKDIRFLSLTGSAPWYGAGGYEVFLSDKPLTSSESFQVRLVDQKGKSLSPGISFHTGSDCNTNLVIINFHQVK